MVFKASSDTPIPLGTVTDVYSYMLKVKDTNTTPIVDITLEGDTSGNQGSIIVSSIGQDI
jgi:hypothetical protein